MKTLHAPLLLAAVACQTLTFDGPPELEAGTGEFLFEPVEAGDPAPIVYGPQGGYHLWAAARIDQMDPTGIILETRLYAPADREDPSRDPLTFQVNLLPHEDGGYYYAGLPQVVSVSGVRDRLVRVEVTATDRGGRTATDTFEVVPYEVDED